MDRSQENALANILRVGVVSSINAAEKKARVMYKDKDDMISGWLYVLQHAGGGVSVVPDGGHTHAITDTFTGGGSASTEPDHKHGGTVTAAWMPKVNDTVLVAYLPIFNGDGFILGVI